MGSCFEQTYLYHASPFLFFRPLFTDTCSPYFQSCSPSLLSSSTRKFLKPKTKLKKKLRPCLDKNRTNKKQKEDTIKTRTLQIKTFKQLFTICTYITHCWELIDGRWTHWYDLLSHSIIFKDVWRHIFVPAMNYVCSWTPNNRGGIMKKSLLGWKVPLRKGFLHRMHYTHST